MVTPVQEQQMTLGLVQRDIKVGTSQVDVAQILGSPNIVTQDADGYETWIYDKVSSIVSYNSSGFGVGIGGFGGGFGSNGGGGGLLNAGYNKNGGVAQSNQKTLTVVLKFDENHNVLSFSYHMSSF
jgi:outer membrane protein assembly factor BamE (lipoprotein component of BamABCDE complex)